MKITDGPAVRLGQGSYERTWPPSQLTQEPAEVYHEKARVHLSSHALSDFRNCPSLFRRKELGLSPRPDSTAFAFGRAAHVLVLEGRERYEAEFAVGGPINEKTGLPYGKQTKAFAEWAEEQGKPVIAEGDAATIEEMYGSVRRHPFARDLLHSGVAEGVLRHDYGEHKCQARYDWISPVDTHGIVDFKTCRNLDAFESDANAYGYFHQLAFYRQLLFLATDQLLPVHIIAAEKVDPYRVGVWSVCERSLNVATFDNETAMKELTQCRKADRWPTRYEPLRVLELS